MLEVGLDRLILLIVHVVAESLSVINAELEDCLLNQRLKEVQTVIEVVN